MAWPVVEDGLRLDIHRVVCAANRHGSAFRWRWSDVSGEAAGWINVAVTLDGATSGSLSLAYRCNDVPFDQRFRLVGEPCRFGGCRWRAVCPVTGARAAKLYSLGGAGFHARRRYGRVAYRSQMAGTEIDRVLIRRDRILFRKLKGDDPGYVPKPKWMRWKTYDRWMEEQGKVEDQLDGHFAVLVGRLGRLVP